MAKKGLALFVMLLIFTLVSTAFSLGYGVTRSVNPTPTEVDTTVTVTLHVYVGDSDAYAIDETVPDGWSLVDAPGAMITDNHVMWLVCGQSGGDYQCSGVSCCIDSIEDTTYTYTLQAPSSPQTATLTGVYMFDTEGTEDSIPDTTVEVMDIPPNECSDFDGDQDACSTSAEGCAWCPLNSNCERTDDIDCTTAACTGNYICTSSCRLSECGVGKECSGNICLSPATCVPDWVCTEWSPAECPADTMTRRRTCTDNNGCEEDETETARCRVATTTSSGSTTTSTRTTKSDQGSTTADTRLTRTVTDSSGSSDGTTGSRRTSSSAGAQSVDTTSAAGRQRTTQATQDEPKTSDQMLEENAETAGSLFNFLLVILILMIVGGGLYFWRKGVHFNRPTKVDLSAQRRFIDNQGKDTQDNNKFRPF